MLGRNVPQMEQEMLQKLIALFLQIIIVQMRICRYNGKIPGLIYPHNLVYVAMHVGTCT